MVIIQSCENCDLFKEALKREIINELIPALMKSCKNNLGLSESVLPNYAISAGVLEEKIKYLQHQIDLNSAKFSEAKSIFESKTRYQQQLIDENFAQIKHAKEVYLQEVDYLLKMPSYLENTTDLLGREADDARLEAESLQMYMRRNILVLEGEEETKGENTNEIALKMFRDLGLEVNFRDICRSHRK